MSGLVEFDDDVQEIQERHPGLRWVAAGQCRGRLNFDASFGGTEISDVFEVEISADNDYPARLPKLREIGGRTGEIAKKHNIAELADLHCNPGTQTACVCVPQDEVVRFPPGSRLLQFIENLAVPYLYGLSFFDKNGRWPWPEFSHGALGLLEYNGLDLREHSTEDVAQLTRRLRGDAARKEFSRQARRPSADRNCPCGSRKPFRKCHPRAWHGIERLRADIGRLALKPRRLFAP